MPVGWDALTLSPGDGLTRAVLLLAGLSLARTVLVAGLRIARRLPGRLGRAAAALGRSLRPGAARRLLALALGVGVPAISAGVDLPSASAQAVDPASAAQAATASRPRPVAPVPPADGARVVETVVVPGDTLWDIARRHLPAGASAAEVAREWPRWYAANRAAIGSDPALIRPGTRLRSPDRRSTGTSTSSHDRPPATPADAGAVARSLDPDRR